MREKPIAYTTCEGCERPYREGSGVAVLWDVMGDPRESVEVCPACAFVALVDDEAAR